MHLNNHITCYKVYFSFSWLLNFPESTHILMMSSFIDYISNDVRHKKFVVHSSQQKNWLTINSFTIHAVWYINGSVICKQYCQYIQMCKSVKKSHLSSAWCVCGWMGVILVWWCLMPLLTIFQLFRGGRFYWWRKPEKTTNLSKITDKLYHIILYTSPWSRFELTTSMVIGTDCIGNPATIRSWPRRPPLALELGSIQHNRYRMWLSYV